jgi:ribosomal protein S18 acetylase RimI-like enzyme
VTSHRVTLRRITDEDEPFLRTVYASTRVDVLTLTDWTDEQKAAFIDMQFNAQHFHYQKYYPEGSFLIIEVDAAPAGRLYVSRWEQEIRIIDIVLLPEFRGRGIGTSLLRDLLDEGQRTGKAVSIHVERINPALRLYERLGFKMIEDKGIYLLMEWHPAS